MNRYYPLVADRADHRCEYCLAPEMCFNAAFDVEHIVPTSRGGTDSSGNLALACDPCNTYKSDAIGAVDPTTGEAVPLFNPRTQVWADHFRVGDDNVAIGLTPIGRATIVQLRLNAPRQLHARAIWRSVNRFP